MLVTGEKGIGVKEMPHVASHAHARDDFVSKYNLASPTRDITISNLLNVFAFAICFAPHTGAGEEKVYEYGRWDPNRGRNRGRSRCE
jgi:hypothetical protein